MDLWEAELEMMRFAGSRAKGDGIRREMRQFQINPNCLILKIRAANEKVVKKRNRLTRQISCEGV